MRDSAGGCTAALSARHLRSCTGGAARSATAARGCSTGSARVEAVRYHSLIVDDRAAADLERIAWTGDGLCMGLRHCTRPLWGVQFHPESVLTGYGEQLLGNFQRLTREHARRRARRGRARPARSVVPRGRVWRGGADRDGARCEFLRLERWVDPELAFSTLFSGCARAAWLDSALAEPGRARFSYMGAGAGEAIS